MMPGPAAAIAALLPTKRPAPMIPPMEIMAMCRVFSDRLSCSFTIYTLYLANAGAAAPLPRRPAPTPAHRMDVVSSPALRSYTSLPPK